MKTLMTGMPWIPSATHSDVRLFAERQKQRIAAARKQYKWPSPDPVTGSVPCVVSEESLREAEEAALRG